MSSNLRTSTGNRRSASAFGTLLAETRRAHGLSQLELALAIDGSAKHISFLETGRSRPSAAMVARLAEGLALSPHARGALLLAAGYAPSFEGQHGRLVCAAHRGSAERLLGEEAFHLALQLQRLADAEAVVAATRPFLRRLGIDYFFTGTLRVRATGAIDIDFDPAGRPPAGWLQRYAERGYRAHDALVRETAVAHAPFFWDEIAATGRLGARERRIIAEAGEFGISNGFVTPIRHADASVRAVSAMGERIDSRDPGVRLAARIVCTGLLEASVGRRPEIPAQ